MNNRGSSAIVGSMLLVSIAVASFGILYTHSMNELDNFIEVPEPNCCIYGETSKEKKICLSHYGGDALGQYSIELNGIEVKDGTNFSIGKTISIEPDTGEQDELILFNFCEGEKQIVFYGVFTTDFSNPLPLNPINLQEAIDNAPEWSTLIVPRGRYTQVCYINKPLIFQGYGYHECIIEGDALVGIPIIRLNGSHITVNNVTVKNSLSFGIFLIESSNTIEHCSIQNNALPGLYIEADYNHIHFNNFLGSVHDFLPIENYWSQNYYHDWSGGCYDIDGGTSSDCNVLEEMII